jgi:hypothetical protein
VGVSDALDVGVELVVVVNVGLDDAVDVAIQEALVVTLVVELGDRVAEAVGEGEAEARTPETELPESELPLNDSTSLVLNDLLKMRTSLIDPEKYSLLPFQPNRRFACDEERTE